MDSSPISSAGWRAVKAFEALGKAGGIINSHLAHQECEKALVALKEALVEADRED